MAEYRNKDTGRTVEAWRFDGSIASVHSLMADHPDVWWERGNIRVRGLAGASGSALVPPGQWIVRDPKGNALSAFAHQRFGEHFEMQQDAA
jgi:hypothetical protein